MDMSAQKVFDRADIVRDVRLRLPAQWVKALYLTDGFFETLAESPQLGSPFGREFTRSGGAYAAVLSDSLWRSALAQTRTSLDIKSLSTIKASPSRASCLPDSNTLSPQICSFPCI
jgi:hypothetical protein